MKKFTAAVFLALILVLGPADSVVAQTTPYTRTVIVNKIGDSATNGAALLAALSSLSPAPDAGNRWVIKIEGGFYDVGTTPIVLPPFVNLEGSGIFTTIVRGSVQPQSSFLGGLVQLSSNVELRDLTIQCLSNATVLSCQAVSIDSAHPKLTDVRILSQGTGSGSHWGIRTFDSAPVLDRVQVLAYGTGFDNYGIVYGGSSTVNLKRSLVTTRNGQNNNWSILLREDTKNSVIRDTQISASGGAEAAGILYFRSDTSHVLEVENSYVEASSGAKSVAIGSTELGGSPNIDVRYGRLYGSTHGVDHVHADIELINTEVHGVAVRVLGDRVRIGGTRLGGSGLIHGASGTTCAGTYDGSYTFYPNTCPP